MAADIPKQEDMGFLQQGEEENQRRGSPERKKTHRPEGSVVVDMEALEGVSLLAAAAPESAAAASPRAPMILQKILTRKLSQRGERKTAGDGDALILPATTSAAGSGDGKVTVAPSAAAAVPAAGHDSGKFVAIAISPTVVASEIAAPTSAAAVAAASPRRTNSSCKRAYGRRAGAASPWLDPRRVLLFFATMSSMGTIILLYFTLSMGTMGDGGDANAR